MKMFMVLMEFVLLLPMVSNGQWQRNDTDDNPDAVNLEESTSEDQMENENDYHLQQLEYYRKHPVNINSEEVEVLSLLSPLHLTHLYSYRKLLGDLIDVYELQSVPGFTVEVIRQLIPYVTIKKNVLSSDGVKQMLHAGEHSVLARFSYTPEKNEGFKSGKFQGTRMVNFNRYRYQYRNILQFGVLTEKDAGEKMITHSGTPDFFSFHFFLKNQGAVKAFAAGDYILNIGQGLVCWQGQAFSKGAEVINIKRQSEIIRPYHSAGEFNFNRGFAITLGKRNTDLTVYLSKRTNSSNISNGFVTSIQTSGLHRTRSEIEDKNNLVAYLFGASIKKRIRGGYYRLNGASFRYALPFQKKEEPYNLFALKGKNFNYGSLDYGITLSNIHLFGEVAANNTFRPALVAGIIASLGKLFDLSLLYRHIDKKYQASFGNAFTEATLPSDEDGIYMGVRLSPNAKWRIDMYVDTYSFDWLKYRISSPSSGAACFIQATYKPSRRVELYTRFRLREKPLDYFSDPELEDTKTTDYPVLHNIYGWRTNLSYQVSRQWVIRTRMEICRFDPEYARRSETGYLFYTELIFKPLSFWLSGNARLTVFETDSYNSRIYAYEPDVQFVSAIPALFNHGLRYTINIKGKFVLNRLTNKQLAVQIKAATTAYSNLSQIGSGDNTIIGNRNSVLKLQFFLAL